MTFAFGHSEQERIEVDVNGYERAPVDEFWDDNWLRVDIRIRAGGFRGKALATILTWELTQFLSDLRPLVETMGGSAEFTTIEEQLSLRLTGDGKRHVELSGEVSDQSGIGNRLQFTFQFDQTQLRASIRELERVTLEFPVRTSLNYQPDSTRAATRRD